jgi:predicted nucleic acid-binding protein
VIVVDSGVWIDFFRGAQSAARDKLRQLLSVGAVEIVVPDLVLFEVLRGFRSERDFRSARALMLGFESASTGGAELAQAAAQHYRAMVERGFMLRSAIDVLLGTLCIERGYTLLHQDRDFDVMRELRGLKTLELP